MATEMNSKETEQVLPESPQDSSSDPPESPAIDSDEMSSDDDDVEIGSTTKEESRVRKLLNAASEKTGLDRQILLTMAKGGLPPAIAFAMYQSNAVSSIFGTQGYLVGVSSVYGLAVLPRAKFVQHILICILGICFGSAMAVLALWTAVQARQHTTSNPSRSYNGSASAVCGIWLFFMIYLVHSMRARYPILTIPGVALSMFVNIASTFGSTATSTADVLAYVYNLLRCFLTGFALAAGVSLFIYPRTCRLIVFKEIRHYLKDLNKSLRAQAIYFESLEQGDMLTRVTPGEESGKINAAKAVKDAAAKVGSMHGELSGDLQFAKREVAYGWLTPSELKKVSKLLRGIMMPVLGLSSTVDLFQRFSESHGWDTESYVGNGQPPSATAKSQMIKDWNDIMKFNHEPFQAILKLSQDGINHILITLKLKRRPKSQRRRHHDPDPVRDIENGAPVEPGEKEFAKYFRRRSDKFYGGRQKTLRQWCHMKGIDLSDDFFKHPHTADIALSAARTDELGIQEMSLRQLFMILYMEWLLYSTTRSILDLIEFADSQRAKGYRKHFIFPGSKQWKKWIRGILYGDDSHNDHAAMGDVHGGSNNLNMGQAFNQRKDPEHLPPTNFIEKVGDYVRMFPAMLRSSASAFGLRVACATLSVSIICFLHGTQHFFIHNRLVWAGVIIAISMTPTAGQSVFSFSLRVLGTGLATVCSLLAWYIPAQHAPGILVFLWLFVSCIQYFPVAKPRFSTVAMISSTTLTMIIGYEIEAQKLGEAAMEASGAAYYDINLLGAYRLAIVSAGLFVAFFWTIFPYPTSEHGELRKNLGSSLYLLANYYSVVHETMRLRMRGGGGKEKEKGTPAHKLGKARRKVYSKQMLLTTSMKTFSDFSKWEIPIGGKFPREKYDEIIARIDSIMNYMTLIRFASQTFIEEESEVGKQEWLGKFRRLSAAVNPTSHEITSLLALLSASVRYGQPLPPYLSVPQPYRLSQRLQEMDKDILSVRHVAERGYAAFAVMQVSTRCIIGDLEKLLQTVKELVGELDFSFHAISTTGPTPNMSVETLQGHSEKEDEKKRD